MDDQELNGAAPSYPLGDMFGDEVRAEITRRQPTTLRYMLAGIIVAALSALGSMVDAIASLVALRSR